MQRSNMILLAFGAIVVCAFLALFASARGTHSAEVDEQELAKALAVYKRAESARARRAKASRARSRPPARPTPREKPDEDEDEEPAPPATATPPTLRTAPPPSEPEETFPKETLKEQMDAANRLYDKRDYEGALAAAFEILEGNPKVVRMLRIVVSASCIMGEAEQAQEHYDKLPARDQRQMARRCKRYGVEFD